MVYNYDNCTLFPECIAISADAAVFNVEIYHKIDDTNVTQIGKANVIISRHPKLIETNPNLVLMTFNGKIDNSPKLQEFILKVCTERCKAI